MNYDPDRHQALADYLEAVEAALISAHVSSASREEIHSNIVAQFEASLHKNPQLDDRAHVMSLDDPNSFATHWNDQRETTSIAPVPAARPNAQRRIFVWIASAALAVFLLIVGGTGYMIHLRNEIVVAHTAIKASWAQVETTLQRRYDLIPNLVETVKGYATHERQLLEEVTRLRSQWSSAQSTEDQQALRPKLESSLIKVMALSEQYPSLAANEQFLALQYQLEGTENRIAVSRIRYNEVLRYYNALAQQFPASLLGYQLNEDFFESVPEAKTAPKVAF